MCGNWLTSDATADIALPSGDGTVNFKDYAALVENRLIDCGLTPGNPACEPK
jgi:hypothetical protein